MKALFFSLILIGTSTALAQQPLLSSTISTPHFNNFALAGTNEVAQVDLISRFQWVGYGQGPTTIMANGFVTLGKNKGQFTPSTNQLYSNPERTVGIYKHVIGGNFFHDRIGLTNLTSVQLSYAIHLPISKTWMISASLSAGYGNAFFKFEDAKVVDQTDFIYNDARNFNQSMFRSSGGIGIYNRNFTFGFGVNQIIRSKTQFSDFEPKGAFQPQFYTNASYDFSAGKINIIPQIGFRAASATRPTLDFGVQVQYNRAIWLGLYGRTSNAMILQVGANLFKQAYLAYTFELPVAHLARVATTTHEVRIGIYLNKRKGTLPSTEKEEIPQQNIEQDKE